MEAWTISELMEEFYGYCYGGEDFDIEVWQQVKDKFGIKEKHYDRYKKGCVMVRFSGYYGGEEFWWCETPKRRRHMDRKISEAGGLIWWMGED